MNNDMMILSHNINRCTEQIFTFAFFKDCSPDVYQAVQMMN